MTCEGDDEKCPDCGGFGTFDIPHCPVFELDRNTAEFIQLARDADNGKWPVGGGSVDESASFMEAYRFYKSECNRCEREIREDD